MSTQQFFTAKQAFNMIIVIILQGLLFQTNAAITSVSAASGRNYQVATLQVGAVQYIDRNFTFTDIDNYGGREYIRTANNDKYSTGSAFLTFTITQPGLVCVAHDDRITQKPSWLSQFTMSDVDLETTDGNPLSVYTRYFDAGTVVLGGNLAGSSGSHISMYSVVVVEQTRPTISDVEVANGRTYRISTVALGEEQYVDRDYVFTQIGSLEGRQFIQAFNNDKFIVSDSFLSFTLDMAAVVYVAHDDRITNKPDWLLDFTDIGINILSSDGNYPFSVFQKVFPAGRVTLGGNAQTTPPNKFISMYTVIVGDAAESVSFFRTYSRGSAYVLQKASDGGYIIGAKIPNGGHFCLVRTTALGDIVWTKEVNDTVNIFISDLQKTSDGGYILTGRYGWQGLLLKVDSSGNEMWRKTFGGETYDYGFSAQQTFGGDYIIGGLTNYGNSISNIFLLRTDENGNELWKRFFGISNRSVLISQTIDSGFIITSNFYPSQKARYCDLYVAKINRHGDTEWTKTYGNLTTDEIPGSIQRTMDGNYIVTGTGWNYKRFLLKIDENGNELWQKFLSFFNEFYTAKGIQTNDGGYAVISEPGINIYKTDGNGNTVWAKKYNGEGVADCVSILQAIHGGYTIAGTTFPEGTWDYKIYLLKTDANGNINQ